MKFDNIRRNKNYTSLWHKREVDYRSYYPNQNLSYGQQINFLTTDFPIKLEEEWEMQWMLSSDILICKSRLAQKQNRVSANNLFNNMKKEMQWKEEENL